MKLPYINEGMYQRILVKLISLIKEELQSLYISYTEKKEKLPKLTN